MRASTKRAAGLIVLAMLAATGFASCGGGDDTAKELSQQRKLDEARKQGGRDQQLKDLQRKLDRMEKTDGSTTAPATSGSGGSSPSSTASSGPTSCGDGLSAGSNTSCPFARSVRDAYPGSGNTFEVYSSVTRQRYRMACTTASPHVCRGGNNASVYFP